MQTSPTEPLPKVTTSTSSEPPGVRIVCFIVPIFFRDDAVNPFSPL